LFLVIAEHTAETCPGGIVRPDKEFFNKMDESMKKSGAKLVEGYFDGPGHAFYIVLEADDNTALNNAVENLRLVGKVKMIPVLKFSDAFAWAKKIGIQK
jgi:uncharacterized protein with GYD domain